MITNVLPPFCMVQSVNSSNKRCTIVYKQSFSYKINCIKVKQTATKLHKSPDETDRARSRSLLQMRDSYSGSKHRLQGTPDSTPLRQWITKTRTQQQHSVFQQQCSSKQINASFSDIRCSPGKVTDDRQKDYNIQRTFTFANKSVKCNVLFS